MPKTPKRPRDPNQLAKSIVDLATGEAEEVASEVSEAQRSGAKGGEARAGRLSERRRSEIARVAAKARWAQKP